MILYSHLFAVVPNNALKAKVLTEMHNELEEMSFFNTLAALYNGGCGPSLYQAKDEQVK